VWSNRLLASNLAAVFRRRQMEAFRAGLSGVPLQSRRLASLANVVAFLRGELQDEKLESLIWALSAIAWNRVPDAFEERSPVDVIPFEFGVLRLLTDRYLVVPRRIRNDKRVWKLKSTRNPRESQTGGEVQANITPDPAVFEHLAVDRIDSVQLAVGAAVRRLKSGGRPTIGQRNRQGFGNANIDVMNAVPPLRLLAAMLFPLSHRDLQWIANRVLYPPENEE
jgi:CRISPR-associated protein Csx17